MSYLKPVSVFEDAKPKNEDIAIESKSTMEEILSRYKRTIKPKYRVKGRDEEMIQTGHLIDTAAGKTPIGAKNFKMDFYDQWGTAMVSL